MGKFRGHKSKRDQIIDTNKAFRAWGIAFGKPEAAAQFITPVPPKRDRIKRPVDGKPIASEHQEQSTVVSWWFHAHKDYGLPEFALFAIPNGGARDVITGARLKQEGVRRGVLDLMLAKPMNPHAGLFIEMKVGDNQPSDHQKAFMEYLEGAGYKCAVHWSARTAIEEIEKYLGDE